MMAAEQPTLVKATDTTEFHPEPPLEDQLRETMQRNAKGRARGDQQMHFNQLYT